MSKSESLNAPAWGSDVLADALRELGVEYVALNPGASFRGLHDSLVNYLGCTRPEMLLCLHEEHAVAIAHGYAKVAERPMAAIVHSNVGLMHASMAVFNAWCDRAPVFLLGATGPVDAARRRPWIDWLHTARDQAALVRDFVKWDDQPASIEAARDSMLRAWRIAQTQPCAPVYLNFDAALQESPVNGSFPSLDVSRFDPPVGPAPAAADLDRAAALLADARRPVILAGRVSRSQEGWDARVTLAESLGAYVTTDLKTAAAFPNRHPLHPDPAGMFAAPATNAALARADVILSLDWIDLAGTLRVAGAKGAVIQASPDELLTRAGNGECQAPVAADVYMLADPDLVVAGLVERLPARACESLGSSTQLAEADPDEAGELRVLDIALALREAVAGRKTTLARAPLSWSGDFWPATDPLDYLGYDGGGGIGSGPGMTVGAALALRRSDRLVVAVVGDGDYLMGVTALWTAAQHKLPLLIVIANNRSFYNDEIHQERVAITRARPVENKWIGQAIRDPDIDLAAMARAQGAAGFGPIFERGALAVTLREAAEAATKGPVVVDVRVAGGYAPSTTAALMRSEEG